MTRRTIVAQRAARQDQGNGGDGALENLLTPDEVCGLLRIKKQRLYEWVHFGRIPYVKIGRFLRFSKSRLEEWLKASSFDIIKGDDSLLK